MCKCVDTTNELLKEGGHILNTADYFDGRPSIPLIGLRRLDNYKLESRSGKSHNIFPRFCPFCGEKYPEHKKGTLIND